jgi:integrase
MVRDARDIDGLITSDPFAAVQWPDKEIRRRDAFTKEDRDKILDYFRSNEPFYYLFILTMFWTGMRPSECTALRVGDVDLKNGTISNHEVASLRGRACAENERESTDDQTFAERRQGFAGSEGAPRH